MKNAIAKLSLHKLIPKVAPRETSKHQHRRDCVLKIQQEQGALERMQRSVDLDGHSLPMMIINHIEGTKRVPSYSASLIRSADHTWSRCSGTNNGC